MTPRALGALVLAAAVAGCGLFRSPPPVPPAQPKYTVGAAYQLGGAWYYPKEVTEYNATGLAAVVPDRAGLTVDGERFDGASLAAAHRTLQLPSVVRVTNLENGRQVLVRVNDRGPANPGRLIGLTRHAADLLGVRDGTQVRVELDGGLSHNLADQLGGGPRVDIAAAPREAVQAQSLAPPPGVAQSSRGRYAAGATRATDDAAAGPAVPDRLPDQVVQGAALPGQIYLQTDEFGRADYAQRLAAKLTGLHPMVDRVRTGLSESYAVRAGPFATTAQADAALDQARRAGVIDARLVVE